MDFEVRKAKKIVRKTAKLEKKIEGLSNEALQNKTADFRDKISNGVNVNKIMPEALAVVREASKRVLGMRHFDVQLIGSIVLNNGDIAEMRTGEGKTLVATAAAYINTLSGSGVHVITANDYLAKRDAELMGKLYNFLGLTVGCITNGMTPADRKNAYMADITYGTNSEFGFDYLRDNMVLHVKDRVQRELNYAIIDEVDSILIDEARTPLIISGNANEDLGAYLDADSFVKSLKKKDYEIEAKDNLISLTSSGVSKAEKKFGVDNLADSENLELVHFIIQALKANYLMKADVDYIKRDGEILIVDEFTGRVMDGRRFSNGLHQAIEAKEKVSIQAESQTFATITIQNYFRMYKKISGMTGTGRTEADEFREIYNMNVVSIPTNKPVKRRDCIDEVYPTSKEKWLAVVNKVSEVHKTGRPILIGTTSVENSELLSSMLHKRGIKHSVLNAKNHAEEAAIIAQSGRLNAVTVSTNMAGRGTDILLGGNPSFFDSGKNVITESICSAEKEEVLNLGGLFVIGTERHESKRIDDQLRGRAGRQGDPGATIFYTSMEDELIKRFNDKPLGNQKSFASLISKTQKKVEGNNFAIRKNVLKYDDVMNTQRKIVYDERNKILNGEDMSLTIKNMIGAEFSDLMKSDDVKDRLLEEFGVDLNDVDEGAILDYIVEKYNEKEGLLGKESLRNIERSILLQVIDNCWIDHLDTMEQLRTGIGLRSLAQMDPAIEYMKEGHKLFDQLMNRIIKETVNYCFHI